MFKGSFRIPDTFPVYSNALEVGPAFLVISVADMRGILSVPQVRILDKVRAMSLGTGTSGLDRHSMSLELGALPFEFELNVKGSQQLGFLPVAGALMFISQSPQRLQWRWIMPGAVL